MSLLHCRPCPPQCQPKRAGPMAVVSVSDVCTAIQLSALLAERLPAWMPMCNPLPILPALCLVTNMAILVGSRSANCVLHSYVYLACCQAHHAGRFPSPSFQVIVRLTSSQCWAADSATCLFTAGRQSEGLASLSQSKPGGGIAGSSPLSAIGRPQKIRWVLPEAPSSEHLIKSRSGS